MDGSNSPLQQVNLQTLVAAIQNAVQAQNLIATNIKALNTTESSFNTAFGAFATALLAAFAVAFPAPLSGSATWDPPSVNDAASTTTTVSVAGAVIGNYVQLSFSHDLQGLELSGYVSAADTVTAVLSNLTGSPGDLASGTLKARVTTV